MRLASPRHQPGGIGDVCAPRGGRHRCTVSNLVVAVIESFEALLALEPEWRRLEQKAQQKLPFLTFDWVTSWWEHLRADKHSVRDSLFVHSVRTADGELVAVAPLMLTERPAFGPLRLRAVQFVGADPNITELRGVLAGPGHELDAQRALHADLMGRAGHWDWVQWAGIPTESPAQSMLNVPAGVRWHRDISNFVLPLEETWDAQRALLKRNIKESIRKCYNSLKRDDHTLTFEVVRSEAAIGAALDDFFRLHRARAEVTGTVVHADVFKTDIARTFLTQICERYAERGITRIFQLRAGDQVVATRIGFALADTLYLYYSGCDPAWAKYSVSTTIVVEAIKYAIAEGFDEVNLSTGEDVSKTRWGPREVVYREGHIRSDRWRGQLAFEGYQMALKATDNRTLRRFARPFLGGRSPA
jgi:CelD/BcsL family acetyltransferase involved in cellulose biosynthesis